MTQEEKQLLLKDLCARLPYSVNVQVKEWTTLDTELKIGHIQRLQNDDIELKPYLRPMSSMTEEERDELENICVINYNEFEGGSTLFDDMGFDWLNAHHFDYRGLIPMDLALEAPERMYKKEK